MNFITGRFFVENEVVIPRRETTRLMRGLPDRTIVIATTLRYAECLVGGAMEMHKASKPLIRQGRWPCHLPPQVVGEETGSEGLLGSRKATTATRSGFRAGRRRKGADRILAEQANEEKRTLRRRGGRLNRKKPPVSLN